MIEVRKALQGFTDEGDGIPGNDDSGAMASWFIFSSIGFLPVAGQDLYLVGVPSYEKVFDFFFFLILFLFSFLIFL